VKEEEERGDEKEEATMDEADEKEWKEGEARSERSHS
jgi:hypothetical protein